MPVTAEQIADRLVKWFRANLAQIALDANPKAISGSKVFAMVGENHRAELMRLVEQKVRALIALELKIVVEPVHKIGFEP